VQTEALARKKYSPRNWCEPCGRIVRGFKCGKCSARFVRGLKQVARTSTENNPWRCFDCGRQYSGRSDLGCARCNAIFISALREFLGLEPLEHRRSYSTEASA